MKSQNGAVSDAVDETVRWAVFDAVSCALHDPRHPALQDFLLNIKESL
jgi:hypothetical protein